MTRQPNAVAEEFVMSKLFRQFIREDEGQDLIEYAMLVALIALICIAAVRTVGTAVQTTFNNIGSQLPIS